MIARLRGELAAWDGRRRAGSRARRKYTELRKRWLRAHRGAWAAVSAAAVGFWVVFWLLMRAFPGDQSWSTAAMAGGLFASIIVFRRTPPLSIASWEDGAFGEEATAKQLRTLEREGWVVLHDLANGTKNFDHVVLGPTGIYCLNSKWSGYRLEEDSRGGLVGRHEYDPGLYRDVSSVVRQAKAEAAALSSEIARRCGQRLWVRPVVVWWGEVARGGRQVDGVGIVQGKHLVERLRAQEGRPVRGFDAVVAALTPGRHLQR